MSPLAEVVNKPLLATVKPEPVRTAPSIVSFVPVKLKPFASAISPDTSVRLDPANCWKPPAVTASAKVTSVADETEIRPGAVRLLLPPTTPAKRTLPVPAVKVRLNADPSASTAPRNRISPPLVAPVVTMRSPFRTVAPVRVMVPPLFAGSLVLAVAETLPSRLIVAAVRETLPPSASRPLAEIAPTEMPPLRDWSKTEPAAADAAATSPLLVNVPVEIAPVAKTLIRPPLE